MDGKIVECSLDVEKVGLAHVRVCASQSWVIALTNIRTALRVLLLFFFSFLSSPCPPIDRSARASGSFSANARTSSLPTTSASTKRSCKASATTSSTKSSRR